MWIEDEKEGGLMSEKEGVRSYLVKAERGKIDEAIWERLVDDGYIGGVQEDLDRGMERDRAFDVVLDRYRILKELIQRSNALSSGGEKSTVLSEGIVESRSEDAALRGALLSVHAVDHFGVKTWREVYLNDFPGNRLRQDQITGWMEQVGECDWDPHEESWYARSFCRDADFRAKMLRLYPESPFASRPAGPPGLPKSAPDGRLEMVPFEGPHTLAWWDGHDKLFMEIPDDGSLFQLKLFAWRVASACHVPEYVAVHFILTGIAMFPTLGYYQVIEDLGYRGAPRVVMNIEPTATQRDVAALYGKAQRDLRRGRYRSLSEKKRQLVVFCFAERGFGHTKPSVKWRETMSEWNSTYPQWEYEFSNLMSRDYWRALRKLVPPGKFRKVWPAD
jgi:hypothetical protein